jgi:hypothetical protein
MRILSANPILEPKNFQAQMMHDRSLLIRYNVLEEEEET